MSTHTPQNQHLVDLLAAISQRNHRAFRELHKLTERHLHGVALRILGRPDRAEEVVQEAYMNVWAQAGSYSPGLGTPMTWLISVVRNKALDLLRFEKGERNSIVERPPRHDNVPGPEPEFEGDGDVLGSDPQALLIQATLQNSLQACFAQLEPAQRQSLMLAFYAGLTHAELAVHLQVPLGTAKAWVRRGLSQLKKCLGQNCVDV